MWHLRKGLALRGAENGPSLACISPGAATTPASLAGKRFLRWVLSRGGAPAGLPRPSTPRPAGVWMLRSPSSSLVPVPCSLPRLLVPFAGGAPGVPESGTAGPSSYFGLRRGFPENSTSCTPTPSRTYGLTYPVRMLRSQGLLQTFSRGKGGAEDSERWGMQGRVEPSRVRDGGKQGRVELSRERGRAAVPKMPHN